MLAGSVFERGELLSSGVSSQGEAKCLYSVICSDVGTGTRFFRFHMIWQVLRVTSNGCVYCSVHGGICKSVNGVMSVLWCSHCGSLVLDLVPGVFHSATGARAFISVN